MTEAYEHPHNKARGTFVNIDGITQSAPAPRFSRTVSEARRPAGEVVLKNHDVLESWGLSASDVAKLEQAGALGTNEGAT